MNRAQGLGTAFVLGIVAGGIAGLLLAPEKGTVTRGKLKGFAGGMGKAAGGAIKTATGTVRKQAEAVKEGVAEGTRAYRHQLDRTHAA